MPEAASASLPDLAEPVCPLASVWFERRGSAGIRGNRLGGQLCKASKPFAVEDRPELAYRFHRFSKIGMRDMKALEAWQNFYVIVGSSAGALIGLQFVVLSLIANRPTVRVDPETGVTFSTPTIIHFSTVLTLAAMLCAPWQAIDAPTLVYGAVGLAGAAYTAVVARRMRRQTAYQPEFEDWLFHVLLPFAAYGILVVSAFAASSHVQEALFGVGAAVLLLLLIGIHNAWDAVTYHIFLKRQK
jgi:hypothetical protein